MITKSLSQKLHSFARDITEAIEYRGFVYAFTPQWFRDFILLLKDYFWYRYNVIKIDTLSFHYHDPVEVLLHANFQVLVDFVEEELIPQEQHELFDLVKEERQLREVYNSGSEADESFIKDSIASLKAQNESTQEILDIYNWWKNREKRKWPEWDIRYNSWHELVGIGELNKCGDYETYQHLPKERGAVEEKLYKEQSEAWGKVDDAYEKEDDDMLLRLIKIRRHLWT